MCFGIDWCRAKSATWLKLPESSIQIQTSGVWGACLGYLRMGGMRPKFLVCPNWPWWVGTGTRRWESLWKLKKLADADLGDGSLPESGSYLNFHEFSANWKLKSDKCKNQTYPSHRKTRKHGRLRRVFFLKLLIFKGHTDILPVIDRCPDALL